MKICLVHEEYPEETNFGGIATYQKNCAEEYVKLGNQVTVICRGLYEDKEYIENGVKIFRIYVKETEDKVQNYIEYRERVCDLLRKLQKEKQFDILEVPDWGAETVFFEKYRKVPLVVRLHTPLKVWLRYNNNDFGKVKDLMLKWENEMIMKADFVTCCSEALKRLIVQNFDIKESEIMVTPNPANITNFYFDKKIKKQNKIVFVGSLEERKGVITLAESLNTIFVKYPNLKIQFIGKDTIRNNKNISTIKYVKEIVDKRFLDNIEFLGQIENYKINKYLNEAKVGVFPSLFDNFPYVVLESMITGLQIVGSENSGMKEMLDDDSSLYISGDSDDLANKIINKLELFKKEPINKRNIKRVNELYNPTKVCNAMLSLYDKTIINYKLKKISKKELEDVLSNVTDNYKIKKYKREIGGVANYVYKVETVNKNYIIKKYVNIPNFELSEKLYNMFLTNNIKVSKPINNCPLKINGMIYNIFEYIENTKEDKGMYKYILNLLLCDRKYDGTDYLINDCYKYYENIYSSDKIKKYFSKELDYVLNVFDSLKNNNILRQKYINHGDISKENLIDDGKNKYIIDFDQTTMCAKIYDFAVVVVKFFVNNNYICKTKYQQLRDEYLKYDKTYSKDDFDVMIKFYLCKILLEKFYLHNIGTIDLFSRRQKKDYYKRYYIILKNFCEMNYE